MPPAVARPPIAPTLIRAASSAIDNFFSSFGDSTLSSFVGGGGVKAGTSVALIFSEAR